MTVLPDLQAQLDEALARNAALSAQLQVASAPKAVTIKVSAKGAISLYGLGRWPVTLYQSQMNQLIGAVPAIRKFIDDHAGELATKGQESELAA